MAKELVVSTTSSQAVYALARIPTGEDIGKWVNVDDNVLEVYDGGRLGRYDIVLTEIGASGFYEGDMPPILRGVPSVDIIFYNRAGGAPAESDTKISGSIYFFADGWIPTDALAV